MYNILNSSKLRSQAKLQPTTCYSFFWITLSDSNNNNNKQIHYTYLPGSLTYQENVSDINEVYIYVPGS